MTEEKNLEQLEEKINDLNKRLDHIEKLIKNNHDRNNGLFGRNIWVLVPIVAIIMWGLRDIL